MSYPISVMAGRAAGVAGLLRAGAVGDEIAAVLREYGEDVSTLDDKTVRSMRPVADELCAIFAAETVAECANLLNRMAARWCRPPRLSNHDGTAWHVHVDSADDAPWAEWLAASAAYALATIVAETGRLPGGICHAEDCERPYIDSGSGGPQRFCSTQCATRTRVATYRRRHP